MFYSWDDTQNGIYNFEDTNTLQTNVPLRNTYTKEEQARIIKNVKSKIKRLKKQQRDMDNLKRGENVDETKKKQLTNSQQENSMTQRELQKFLKKISK